MDPQYELTEAKSEVARHHADFERIATLVHEALEEQPWTRGCTETCGNAARYEKALRKIRNIVG